MFKQKYINFLILGIFVFLSCGLSSLAQNYENNLLKTDISQNALGQVKVTLSTKKPYNDKVIVNKKSDTEYVILMPETSNSMTSAPYTKNAQGVISSVDVKTQPYQGNLKGYTKITVKTTRPVEVVSSVRTFTESAISQNEYNQLMAQTAKKPQPTVQSVNKTVQNIAKQNVSAAKTTVNKVQNKVTTVAKNSNINSKNITKVIDKSKNVIEKTNLIPQKTQPKKVQQKQIQKPVQKSVVKKEEAKIQQQEKVNAQPKNIENTQNEVDKSSENEQVVQNESQEIVNENISTSENEEVSDNAQVVQPEPQKKSPVMGITHFIDYILRFVRNNIILASAVGLLAFLILISFVKKMQRASNSMNQSIKANMKDEKRPVDYNENITEDMSWKEKFNTVQEQEQKVAQLQKGIEQAKNDLNDLFNENEIEQEQDDFSSIVLDDDAIIDDEVYTDEESFLDNDVNDILANSEEDIDENEAQNEFATESYSNDDTQYNEEFTEQIESSVEQIEQEVPEEIEILNNENLISDDLINDAQQDLIPENIMEAEDVFNDISEDEIQEQVLNSMQQESLIDTDDFEDLTDEFSDETSIEDLFDEENATDTSLDSVREKYELEQEQKRIAAEKQALKEAKAAREAELKAKEIAKQVIEEGAVTNSVMNIVKDDLIAQHAINQPTNSIEEVKYSADIDDAKGFYLVDLNGASALIGHINDDIFVIKQFDNIVSSPIKIRVNETTPNGISYMTRVGSFRGVVEVSDYNMKLLIEL